MGVYTHLFTDYDSHGYLQLLFHNISTGDALFFDGFDFTYSHHLSIIPSNYKLIKPSGVPSRKIYEVESIRKFEDMSFIKFRNGDIFQIYFMMDDECSDQILNIFTPGNGKALVPTGMTVYEAALERFNEAEECKIEEQAH